MLLSIDCRNGLIAFFGLSPKSETPNEAQTSTHTPNLALKLRTYLRASKDEVRIVKISRSKSVCCSELICLQADA